MSSAPAVGRPGGGPPLLPLPKRFRGKRGSEEGGRRPCESTGRHVTEHGYDVAFASDAIGSESLPSYEAAIKLKYPLRVLVWHEIVNDRIGDLPVAMTFCPLCNTALVFDRRHGGRVLDFGVSGRLRHSDMVMYDR